MACGMMFWIIYPLLEISLSSNLLWISRIKNPNNTAPMIKALFTIPSGRKGDFNQYGRDYESRVSNDFVKLIRVKKGGQ